MKKIKFEYRITLAYLLIGGIWIIFSDKILNYFIDESKLLTELQTYKGWFYVVVTGILFYLLLKKHLEKLRKAEFEAKESDRLKTAFLQNISHEIRTPMNGIIGFTNLLETEDLPENKKKEYLQVIARSSNQLLAIVNDVLDISLIETGNIKVNNDSSNINLLMDELFHSFQPIVKKDIRFFLEKELNDSSAFIFTDIVKLRQIIYNLLSNAVKFTDEGFIKFGYTLKNNKIEFFVEDSGIGITPSLQSKIFERFSKAEKQNFKLYEGVGLGLAICKGNADLLEGEISVESKENKGSKFTFTIRHNPVVQKQLQTELSVNEPISEEPGTILIVEDEESNFLFIKEIFKHAQIDYIFAENGKEAVEICKKHNNISLVLMDLKMPEMNGYEATRLIKEFKPELQIIAQTAFALEDEKIKVLQSGFDGYISKPFKKDQLLEIISEFMSV